MQVVHCTIPIDDWAIFFSLIMIKLLMSIIKFCPFITFMQKITPYSEHILSINHPTQIDWWAWSAVPLLLTGPKWFCVVYVVFARISPCNSDSRYCKQQIFWGSDVYAKFSSWRLVFIVLHRKSCRWDVEKWLWLWRNRSIYGENQRRIWMQSVWQNILIYKVGQKFIDSNFNWT